MSAFTEMVAPYAEVVSGITGHDPAIIISQWHLETGGEIPENFNLGGIKSGWAEYSRYGVAGGEYMSYPSLDFFARDYADFIQGRSYRDAGILQAGTPQEFYTALKTGGYAEDPEYITKGISRYASIFGGTQPVSKSVQNESKNLTWKDIFKIPEIKFQNPQKTSNEAGQEMIKKGIAKKPTDTKTGMYKIGAVVIIIVLIFVSILQVLPLPIKGES